MSALLTLLLLAIGLGLFGWTIARRLAPLRALRGEDRVGRLGERIASLLRFGFGQRRLLAREELLSGALHATLFIAFLVLAFRTVTLFGMGLPEGFHLPGLAPTSAIGRAYLFVKDVVVLGTLLYAAGLPWRRLVTRPERLALSWEGTLVLVLLNFLPHGKHFHVLTALPSVFLRALPPGSAVLRTLDLESEGASFGTATLADLSWKEGLDVSSCTECGRCPTHVTGKPLSVRELNRALKHHLVAEAPDLRGRARAREPSANSSAALAPLVGEVISPDTVWACSGGSS